ncbi:hypothetical protein [Enterobacter phage N5822]|nr:hypothetical protein [Enterobacter phage N5822]
MRLLISCARWMMRLAIWIWIWKAERRLLIQQRL